MLTVVWSGVDWFEYSCKGRLGEGSLTARGAQGTRARRLKLPQPYPGTLASALRRTARALKPWAWLLKGDDLHLRLSDKTGVPPALACVAFADGLAALRARGPLRSVPRARSSALR